MTPAATAAPQRRSPVGPKAEQRVRLGLVVAELVKANSLHAKSEQVSSHIEELAASYEKPADVVRWYQGDNRRMAEVEGIVIENNAQIILVDTPGIFSPKRRLDRAMVSTAWSGAHDADLEARHAGRVAAERVGEPEDGRHLRRAHPLVAVEPHELGMRLLRQPPATLVLPHRGRDAAGSSGCRR